MKLKSELLGSEKMEDLVERKIIPPDCTNIEIDIPIDNLITIKFTVLANKEQLKELLGIT